MMSHSSSAYPLQNTMDIIIVFMNTLVLCREKIYYIKYNRLFSHSINNRHVVQSIKNIFKHNSVAEIQLGVATPVSSPWGCGGALTHLGVKNTF